jgi:hypothetical protein
MSSFIRSAILPTFVFALALPVASFAKDASYKGHITVDAPIVIADHALKAGTYQVRWQETGNTAQVDVVDGGKVLVSTTAQVKTLAGKASDDMIDTVRDASGQTVLVEARFSGQVHALDFNRPQPASN